MKTRQFKQLAGLPPGKRPSLVVDGLRAIGANVAKLAEELEQCNEAKTFRAASLLYNVGREEAGKFLVLIDAYRAPDADQATISRQFKRARDHLSKLIYAQIADYSIASQDELISAIDRHRQALYLDGPNDYDWIFRNELLSERENSLYVDLVDTEGELSWWTPHDYDMPVSVPWSMRLVQALLTTGFISPAGLEGLREAWTGFDPREQSQFRDWADRTKRALRAFPDENTEDGRWSNAARFIADRWPMPMVELDVEEANVEVNELVTEREARYEAEMMREYGNLYGNAFPP